MKKTIIKTALTTIATMILLSISAFAGEWVKEGKCRWYNNGDGTYPKSTWKWIDDNNDGMAECYYFDDDGYLVTNNDGIAGGFTINKNGARVTWDTKEVISVHVNNDVVDTISGTYVLVGAHGYLGKGSSFIPDESERYIYLQKKDESTITFTFNGETLDYFRVDEDYYAYLYGDGGSFSFFPDGTVRVHLDMTTYDYKKC